MDNFEYKTVALNHPSKMEDELNSFGKKGWELVSVISNPQLGSTKYALVGISVSTVAILKRKCGNVNGGK